MAQVAESPPSSIPPAPKKRHKPSQAKAGHIGGHPYPRKLGETQLSSPSQIKLGHKCPPHCANLSLKCLSHSKPRLST